MGDDERLRMLSPRPMMITQLPYVKYALKTRLIAATILSSFEALESSIL